MSTSGSSKRSAAYTARRRSSQKRRRHKLRALKRDTELMLLKERLASMERMAMMPNVTININNAGEKEPSKLDVMTEASTPSVNVTEASTPSVNTTAGLQAPVSTTTASTQSVVMTGTENRALESRSLAAEHNSTVNTLTEARGPSVSMTEVHGPSVNTTEVLGPSVDDLCGMNDIITVNDNSDGSSSSSSSSSPYHPETEEAFQLEHPDLYVKARIEDYHFGASTAKELFIEQCEGKCREYEGGPTFHLLQMQSFPKVLMIMQKKILTEPYIDIRSEDERNFLDHMLTNQRFRCNIALNYFECPLSGAHWKWEQQLRSHPLIPPPFERCSCKNRMTGQETYEHMIEMEASCRYHYLLKKFMDKLWQFPIPDPEDHSEYR